MCTLKKVVTLSMEPETYSLLSAVQLLEGDDTETKHQWEDITSLLTEVSQAVGEVLKSKGFTLYEAMSALELMDPKMDPGVNASSVHNFDEALQLGEIKPSSQLPILEIIGIMDRLLSFEFMWLHGDSPTQTLFTCLYFFRPFKVLDDKFLSPFAFALFKRCSILRTLIISADLYEEEDFSRFMSFLEFAQKDEKDILAQITQAENELLEREKGLKAKGAVANKLAPLQEDPSLEASCVAALLSRLRFSRSWLNTVSGFTKKTTPTIIKALKQNQMQLELIQKQINIGKIPDHLFQPEIARRLPSSSHPKKITILSTIEAVQLALKMMNHLTTLTTMYDYTKIEDLRLLIIKLVDEGASIVVRSYFSKIFYDNDKVLGKYPMRDLLIQDGKDIANIPDAYFTFDFTRNFMDALSRVFQFYVNLCSVNKARRRRKLLLLFHELAILSDEASRVDSMISKHFNLKKEHRMPYFLIWMFDTSYNCMVDYLQLGFELDLYDRIEYPSIFWYIANLFNMRKQQHTYLLKYDQFNQFKTLQAKAPKKPKARQQVDVIVPTPHHYKISFQHELANSVLKFVLALQSCYKDKNDFNFPDEKNRYITRFEGFFLVHLPQPFHYEQYVKDVTEATNVELLLKQSDDASKASKVAIEKLLSNPKSLPLFKQEEVKILQKVGITNNVQIAMNKKKLGAGKVANGQIDYNFTLHRHYPVVSIGVTPGK